MNLIVLSSVDSTNNYLQTLLDNNSLEEGTVVISLEQTKGRGQRGNSWQSLPGDGLYASILFLPQNFSVENQYFLNKAIACGTARYIASKVNDDVKIKWPNDILIGDKKVAGILIENSIRGNQIASVTAGIGINLNQLHFDFNYGTPGTSLRISSNKRYEPELEVVKLFDEIWSDYQQLLNGKYDLIAEDYQKLLYKAGEESKFISDQEFSKGILVEVDKEGAAIIEVDGKRLRCLHPQTRMIVK
ncbi:MAG: biotin--[acetyl-CoA-carboxylase] ligase [Bacteroidetes bacterium]|nr:biotin--[acetyl-CoA-carboxylase] ligase [Bacteroidota bacterium]